MNIFSVCDFYTERDRGLGIPYVKTAGSELVKKLLAHEMSSILIGKKGIGKSAAGHVVHKELITEGRKICWLHPQDIYDLFESFWGVVVGTQEEEGIWYRETVSVFKRRFAIGKWLGNGKGAKRKNVCYYSKCKRADRCKLDGRVDGKEDYKALCDKFVKVKGFCPIKQYIILMLLEGVRLPRANTPFVIDTPDGLNARNFYLFEKFIIGIQRAATIVVFMNPDQYKLCNHSNIRIPAIDFPAPSEDELVTMTKKRSMRGEVYIPKGELMRIIDKADGLPRRVVQEIGLATVLGDLRVKKVEGAGRRLALESYLKDAIKNLKGEGKEWIKVKEMKSYIEEEYGISDISLRNLGRLMKSLGLKHRANPDSEYRI